jgi:hypothetical protein
MRGLLKIGNDELGEVDFKVIDEGMGAIGGNLATYPAYENYKEQFQLLYERNGNANSDDFKFTIVLEDNSVIRPKGGVCLTDSAEFEERYVDAAGIDYEIIAKMKSKG